MIAIGFAVAPPGGATEHTEICGFRDFLKFSIFSCRSAHVEPDFGETRVMVHTTLSDARMCFLWVSIMTNLI